MSATFDVTESMLRDFCSKGMVVEEMAKELTKLASAAGIESKCSVGQVKKLCKTFNIDLKKKPLKSVFVAVGTPSTPVTSNTVQDSKTEEKTEDKTVTETIG